MHNIPEEEARALLTKQQSGECDDEWQPHPVQPGTFQMVTGLVDTEGVGTRMQASLIYRRGHKTGVLKYVFTVFRRTPYGMDRVYQLDVTQRRMPTRDAHDKPHEHFGAARTVGHQTWDNWTYEQVLLHFCRQANIVFSPEAPHPEHFSLKGNK